jgi:hypothetical protein
MTPQTDKDVGFIAWFVKWTIIITIIIPGVFYCCVMLFIAILFWANMKQTYDKNMNKEPINAELVQRGLDRDHIYLECLRGRLLPYKPEEIRDPELRHSHCLNFANKKEYEEALNKYYASKGK